MVYSTLFRNADFRVVLYSLAEDTWKIADFGLTAEGTSVARRVTLHSRGTASYRAPELLLEEPFYNNKTDIWALGCICYEITTRERAFAGDWAVHEYKVSGELFEIPGSKFKPPVVKEADKYAVRHNVQGLLNPNPASRPTASSVMTSFRQSAKLCTASEIEFLLRVLVEVHRSDVCTRPEFLEYRAKLYSQAAIYGMKVHPEAIKIVDNVKNTLRLLNANFGQFIDGAEGILRACEEHRTSIAKLVRTNGFVLGRLYALGTDIEKEKRKMDKRTAAAIVDANDKSITHNIPVLGRWRTEKPQKDAEILNDGAAKSFLALMGCFKRLNKVIVDLGSTFYEILIELENTAAEGRLAWGPGQGRGARARYHYQILQESAKKIIGDCDLFLLTRLSYPRAMTEIKAHEALTEEILTDWIEALQLYFARFVVC
jgi:hypothetical protein